MVWGIRFSLCRCCQHKRKWTRRSTQHLQLLGLHIVRWRFNTLRCILRNKQSCYNCRLSMVTSRFFILSLHCCQFHISKIFLVDEGFQTFIHFNKLWGQDRWAIQLQGWFQILCKSRNEGYHSSWFNFIELPVRRCFIYTSRIGRTCHQCPCFNVLRTSPNQNKTIVLRTHSVSLILSVLPLQWQLGK